MTCARADAHVVDREAAVAGLALEHDGEGRVRAQRRLARLPLRPRRIKPPCAQAPHLESHPVQLLGKWGEAHRGKLRQLLTGVSGCRRSWSTRITLRTVESPWPKAAYQKLRQTGSPASSFGDSSRVRRRTLDSENMSKKT